MILRLALGSLANRRAASVLTVVSIALSVALLLGVEQVRRGVRESFSQTLSKTDLIVAARGGSLQIVLATVFGIGAPAQSIRWATLERYRQHPAVAWVVPLALGDSHRGFRVIGTDERFLEHYRYRRERALELAEGHWPRERYEVAIGHQVAVKLGYRPGRQVVVSHGLGGVPGLADHDEHPFTVAGVLARTATPVDRALYVSLEGLAAIHEGWGDGEAPPAQSDVKYVSAFLLGTHARIDALRLQREIHADSAEPLSAVVPGVALSELWGVLDLADGALKLVLSVVVVVSLLGMLVSLLNTLGERRREMAILRAAGARAWQVAALLVLESGVLTLAGCAVGLGLELGVLAGARPLVESAFGLYLPVTLPALAQWLFLLAIAMAGLVVGLVPAWLAYRNTLADGLAVRV